MLRRKVICLTLMMLTALCQFAPFAHADDGDWTPTNIPQWWWIYVKIFKQPPPHWIQEVDMAQVAVATMRIDPATQDMSDVVVYSLKNSSKNTVKCDGSVTLLHTVRGADGSVVYKEVIAQARIASLAPGATFQLRGTAFTPGKLAKFQQKVEVEVR